MISGSTIELFLWLYGIPGCGKTILSSTIIEDVLYHYHDPTMAVIYFYFDFNDVEKQQYEKNVTFAYYATLPTMHKYAHSPHGAVLFLYERGAVTDIRYTSDDSATNDSGI
jgi:hypothetical protein